jgi:DNA-binding beta-propeller fold protein YncE
MHLHLHRIKNKFAAIFGIVAMCGVTVGFGETPSSQQFKIASTIPLAGSGNWDYIFADSDARRLYVTLDDSLVVLNLDTQKPIGRVRVGGFVHGVALVPSLGIGFASSGEWPGEAKSPDEVAEFDLRTLTLKRKIKVGGNPDCIIYDTASKRLLAFNHSESKSASVIDPASFRVERTLALGGPPESAVSDGDGHVYVNLEDADQIASINTRTWKVEAHWQLGACRGPSALTRDAKHSLLFSACSNDQMSVVDVKSGTVIANPTIGDGPDAALYDPVNALVFSANYDGTLTILHQDAPARYSTVQVLKTAPDARTFAVDTKTGRMYLPVADVGPVARGQDIPTVTPNTFRLLVVERVR